MTGIKYLSWMLYDLKNCLSIFYFKIFHFPFPSILIISYLSTALVLVLPRWLKNAIRQILFSFLAHQIWSTSIIHLCSLLYIMLLNSINISPHIIQRWIYQSKMYWSSPPSSWSRIQVTVSPIAASRTFRSCDFSSHQGGRTWQPFVGGKNGHENFRQTRIHNVRDKCVVFARNCKFANLTQ